MVILLSEEYESVLDKISDNLDFSIWVFLFSVFLIFGGVVIWWFFKFWWAGLVVMGGVGYFCYLFWKLSCVREKFSITEYGIHSQRVFLSSKFKRGDSEASLGADDFYVVFSDIEGFRFKGCVLRVKNKNSSFYDDLDYKFSGVKGENVEKVREILIKYGVSELK